MKNVQKAYQLALSRLDWQLAHKQLWFQRNSGDAPIEALLYATRDGFDGKAFEASKPYMDEGDLAGAPGATSELLMAHFTFHEVSAVEEAVRLALSRRPEMIAMFVPQLLVKGKTIAVGQAILSIFAATSDGSVFSSVCRWDGKTLERSPLQDRGYKIQP